MTGRVGSTDEQADDGEQVDDGRRTGRLLLGGLLALALVATVILVFSESAEWLRVGVLAALWAAFIGAVFAAKYRGQVHERQNEIADLQELYELELEREVSARREYELELEAKSNDEVADEHAKQLDALRAELRVLRENIEALVGGEVLVERVALRAESTRMRSLQNSPGRAANQPQRALAQHTMLEGRFIEGERVAPTSGRANRAEATVRAEPVASPPNATRPPTRRQEPSRRRPAERQREPHETVEPQARQHEAATEFWPTAEAAQLDQDMPRNQDMPRQREMRRQPAWPEPTRQAPAAEATPAREPAPPRRQPDANRRETPSRAGGAQPNVHNPAAKPPRTAAIDPDWTPSWESGRQADKAAQAPSNRSKPRGPAPNQPPPAQPPPAQPPVNRSRHGARDDGPPEPPAQPKWIPEVEQSGGRGAAPASGGGHRRKAEPPAAAQESGAHRTRGSEEPATPQGTGGAHSGRVPLDGGHGRHESQVSSGSHSRDAEPGTEKSTGAHAEGLPVSELLAAYRDNGGGGRRRRRDD